LSETHRAIPNAAAASKSTSVKADRGSRFYFHCSDTGSGIAPECLPHIFDRFTQFSERGKSGTIDLGLAIVKDIIEQHGADIRVVSSPGKGTTFIFWIPVEEGEDYEKNIDS
jgi:signal transduction histidine kinase